VGTKLNIPVY